MPKIAMLGTGLIGTFYTMALHGARSRDQVQVVYSRSLDHAQKFSHEWKIPTATPDLTVAINDPEVQVVVVGLPNSQHEKAVNLAAQAGQAILCTNPPAPTGPGPKPVLYSINKPA